jgi:hypothetical protein
MKVIEYSDEDLRTFVNSELYSEIVRNLANHALSLRTACTLNEKHIKTLQQHIEELKERADAYRRP